MAIPVLRTLHEWLPRTELHVLVLWRGSADILRDHPAVHRIHQHAFHTASPWRTFRVLQGLRRLRFDVSLNTHPQGRHAYRIISRWIGARQRLSHRYENGNRWDRWLVTDSIPQDYGVSCTLNSLRLLPLIPTLSAYGPPDPPASPPPYELFLDPSEIGWAQAWLRDRGLDQRPWLGVHVGSGGTKNLALRRWPLDHYMTGLGQWFGRSDAWPVIAFGGPDESGAHARLSREWGPPRFHVASTPGLRHAAALLQQASAFLSVDTAFMHLAAWARVPHQFVIETPTLTPSVHPPRPDWIRIPNPGLHGNHLDYYRYDGRSLQGSREELESLMRQVTPDQVVHVMRQRLLPATPPPQADPRQAGQGTDTAR
jgi:ADP-heptose:LPS heptosyltransferase